MNKQKAAHWSLFQNSVRFEKGFRKSGLKSAFSTKSKVTFPKTEVLGMSHWIGLILCIFFIALALFSEGFIIAHADHNCYGSGCPVCLQIQGAQYFFRQLRHALFQIFLPLSALLAAPLILKLAVFNFMPISSIRLKVKMNR